MGTVSGLKGTSTFWKILGTAFGAAVVIALSDKLFNDKPDKMLVMMAVIVVALAEGFNCVVEAIREFGQA